MNSLRPVVSTSAIAEHRRRLLRQGPTGSQFALIVVDMSGRLDKTRATLVSGRGDSTWPIT
jgi:hypothetical protein